MAPPETDSRLSQFLSFVGSHLSDLVCDPACTQQLASQQPAGSAVHQAWLECGAQDAVQWLNRPRAMQPLLLTLEQSAQITACALSGDYVALGFKTGKIALLSLGSAPEELWRGTHEPQSPDCRDDIVTDRSERIEALAFYVDPSTGRLSLASAGDICIWLWDVERGVADARLAGHLYCTNPGGGDSRENEPLGPCECKHYLLDSKWSRLRGDVCGEPGHSSTVKCVAASPRATLLASGADDKMLKLWSLEACVQCHTLHGHRGEVRAVAFSSETCAVSCAEDQSIFVWRWELLEVASGARGAKVAPVLSAPSLLGWVRCPCQIVSQMCLSPDGRTVAAAADPMMTSNTQLCVYDLEHASPPVDAAVVSAMVAAVGRGESGSAAREARPEWVLRRRLAASMASRGAAPRVDVPTGPSNAAPRSNEVRR